MLARLQFRLIAVVIVLGALVLAAIVVWLPPADPDGDALAAERKARLASYRLNKPLPQAPDSATPLEHRLAAAGFKLGTPLFVRIYKRSFELEVWLQRDGGFTLFATYPICYFSGQLGPKLRHGDWQAPEGIYRVAAKQLNALSAHHRAFNLGFPNAYDKAHGRSGSYLMVHGGCSSIGCYAITNPAVDDLFRLAKAALAAGQPGFQVQALPFRMTAEAMALRAGHPQAPFWGELKAVADSFEAAHMPPDVTVCDGHYRVVGRPTLGEGRCRAL